MPADQRDSKDARKLWDMVDQIRIAMLTTMDGGVLRSRPMECMLAEGNGVLWFFTNISSHKTSEVSTQQQVNLGFADTVKQNYVSISGRASVVRDQAKAKELWTEDQRAWFPRGLEDPDLGLLRIEVEQAEFWDRPSAETVGGQGLVKAVADETPDLGENKKLDLEHAR